MNEKFLTSLYILIQYQGVIEARVDYLKRNSQFVNKDFYKQIFDTSLSQKDYRELLDLKININSRIFLNIIDLFSYNEEYTKYFVPNIVEEINLKNRIINAKSMVKEYRKEIDWDELKSFRNHILAHNLRNSEGNISLQNLGIMHNKVLEDVKTAIIYFEKFEPIFKLIDKEFEKEITTAKEMIKFKIMTLKNKI